VVPLHAASSDTFVVGIRCSWVNDFSPSTSGEFVGFCSAPLFWRMSGEHHRGKST
jgi:hypothetical protein